MGLCKCPRKKVTNLFCFQHKVNVCEHCLVASHPTCIVQSYLRWLRDSDFQSICTLCNVELDDENSGECIRLMCFDVFHWRCLDQFCRNVSFTNEDLSAFKCPACQNNIFPAENVVSPLAEALRQMLAEADWARPGLGLPEMPALAYDSSFDKTHDATRGDAVSYDEEYNMNTPSIEWAEDGGPSSDGFGDYENGQQESQNSTDSFERNSNQKEFGQNRSKDHIVMLTANEVDAHMRGEAPPRYEKANQVQSSLAPARPNGLHKVHNLPESYGYDGFNEQRPNVGMRNIDSHFRVTSTMLPPLTNDNDDKYKRRTPAIWMRINNWPNVRRFLIAVTTYKLLLFIMLLCLIGFILLDMFIKYGRTMADREPFLDPMANPNIRVNSG